MAYSVKCWTNTGYNAVNIPDSAAMLGDSAFDLPALDIVQDWGLSEVRVRVGDNPIANVDYVRIGSEYYSCTGVAMQAPDVAVLQLQYDAITSCGGPGALVYLDGVTERHTTADDTMFKYTQDDPLMAPREALQLKSGGMKFKINAGEDAVTVVESTIDLLDLGKSFTKSESGGYTGFKGSGVTFSDPSDDSLAVTVPYTKSVSGTTEYTISYSDAGKDSSVTVRSPATMLYDASNATIQNGLAMVRALGVESAVVSQTAFPASYIHTGSMTDGIISTSTGITSDVSSDLPYAYTAVRNNRLLYGEYNKYGLVTADGSKSEFLPEQIAENGAAPAIRMIPDPRPDGKPYFRFRTYMGDSSIGNFWISAITGLNWREVPLVYSSPKNSILDTMNFTNSAKSAGSAQRFNQSMKKIDMGQTRMNSWFNAGKGMASSLTDFGEGNIGAGISGLVNMVQGLANSSIEYGQQQAAYKQSADQYALARDRELQNYGFSQSVVEPEVMFPYNSNAIRDFVGNGVLVYRYRYSDNDITRIDKLLTMYGYKDTTALTPECFVARQNFDYVQASGVSIGGNIPLWKKDVITAQLNAGVRVWHTKPSPAYYTNNPIRSGGN